MGTSNLNIVCSNAVIESGNQVVALISMSEKVRPNNSVDISLYAKQHDIPYHELDDNNSIKSIDLLRNYTPNYIFVSWSKIIKVYILNVPNNFCIGTHPSNLPFNWGRHHLYWIIALGIPETKLSFFKMNKGIHTGDVLLQVPFKFSSDDNINNLNDKMNHSAYEGTKKLWIFFQSHTPYKGEKQNHKLANYWGKSTPHDITLHLRMPADLIIKIVG